MSNLLFQNEFRMSYDEQREKQRKIYQFSRSLLDYIVGLLVIAVGAIFVKSDHFGIKRIQKADNDGLLIPLFGGICILYGLWRIYRGYQKKY